MPRILACLVCLALLAGCAGSSNHVVTQFVEAQQGYHAEIAPEYLEYVRADPRLTPGQIRARELLVQSWERSLILALQVGGEPR